MNSTRENDKSKAHSERTENPPSLIKDLLTQLRNSGISAFAGLDKDEQGRVVNWAQDVVNQYGFILKDKPMKIKNLDDLPCSKEDLKIAIKVLLPAYITKGSDDIVDMLKERYVRLGAFPEISQIDKDTILKEANRLDQKTDSTENALFPTYQRYMEIILSEEKILLEEINSFVDDLLIQKKDS